MSDTVVFGVRHTNMTTISGLKGAVVTLVLVIPLWWLPILMQREIPIFWLAAMAVPPVLLGGYIAARKSQRPIMAGMFSGLVAMSFASIVTLSTEELWLAPIVILVGGALAALGARIAVSIGHVAT